MPTPHRNFPRIVIGPDMDAGFVCGVNEGVPRCLARRIALQSLKASSQRLGERYTRIGRPALHQAFRRVFRVSHRPVPARSSEVKLNRLIPFLSHEASLLYATVASQWSASRLVPRAWKESRRAA